MILPIVPYGKEILREGSKEITPDYPNLSALIADMWETMYEALGVGLAAVQIGKNIRLFLVDSTFFFRENKEKAKNFQDKPGFKGVFINAKIIEKFGPTWMYREGCLSIPNIWESVSREEHVTLEYLDENFQHHIQTFTGFTARVILHEYDHTEGKLFIDYLPLLKKKLIAGKLKDIVKGKVGNVSYKLLE